MDPDPTDAGATADPIPTDDIVLAPSSAVSASTVGGSPATATGHLAGKTRNPWGVWGLSIVTLGIYFLYWYYKVNSEVRDYDRTIEVEPAISVVAQFIPIASIVSVVKTAGRIDRAQTTAGTPERCSGLVGFLLLFVLGTWVVYYQSQLNKVWDQYGNPAEGTPV